MGTETSQNPSENARLRGTPQYFSGPPLCANFVQLSLRCTLGALLAVAALGCDPPATPPPLTSDGGTVVSGTRLVVAVRLAVGGEPWESLEAPALGDDFHVAQLTLAVAGARSPSDRVDLPVPQSSGPTRLSLVGGPRDVELVGASPATYGRAVLDLAPPTAGAPSIELRITHGAVTYEIVSTRPMTLDAPCAGEAVQLDPDMVGVLRLSLPTEDLIEVLADLEPTGATTVRIDATTAPEVLAEVERVLAEAWRADCRVAPEEHPMSPSLSAEPADAP